MRLCNHWPVVSRRYRISDREALVHTVDAVCAEGHWMHTSCFEPTPMWEHALAEPGCPCHLLLIADCGGHVVGWCRVFPIDGTKGEVGIGLLPLHRGKGLGTRLLREVVSWAERRGLYRLVALTRHDNIPALRLFRSRGFRVAGVQNGEWTVLELPLGGS